MRLGFHFRPRVLGAIALTVGLIFVLVPSARAASGKKAKVARVDITKLVWPPPPDQPRIRYIGQYNGELDLLGKKQAKGGLLERVAGVSVTPEERPRLVKPYGAAVDSKGRVYVADWAQHMVLVFDLEHKTLQFRGDKAPANLQTPIGVAVDDRDRLFVSDSKLHQITCFGPTGKVAGVFGAADLQRPAGVAVDVPLRRLYVVDVGGKRIAVFDLDSFKLLKYFGEIKDKAGDRTGALTNPNSIAIDPDGLLYITDAIVSRIVVFDTEGNFVRAWGKRGDGPGMFGRPKGIAIDSDGHVYVADSQTNRMQVFSSEGKPLVMFAGPGWGPGQFMLMGGVAIDSHNRIVAVDMTPARIQVFHYITDAEAAAAKAGLKAPPTEAADQEKAPQEAQPADSAATSGPTVQELQKELAELKAKLAAQEQKSDAVGNAKGPADNPAQEAPGSTK